MIFYVINLLKTVTASGKSAPNKNPPFLEYNICFFFRKAIFLSANFLISSLYFSNLFNIFLLFVKLPTNKFTKTSHTSLVSFGDNALITLFLILSGNLESKLKILLFPSINSFVLEFVLFSFFFHIVFISAASTHLLELSGYPLQ